MSLLAMYIQGDIYPADGNDPSAVVSAIINSELTTPILALCHVNCSATTCPDSNSPPGSHDGDITFNDTLIVRDGNLSWPATIKSLRAGRVTKIFASFGGSGVPDYSRIGKIIARYGTGSNSPLYKNFVCLKETLGLDGIDFDDEDSYDQSTIVSFGKMLRNLGLEITFCPYTRKEFWACCIQALGAGNVSWINLQCYAGGKGNDPGDWTDMGVPVVTGVCANCKSPKTTCSVTQVKEVFQLWTTGKGSVSSDCWAGSVKEAVNLFGGFIWTYAEVSSDLDAYVDAMASGL